MPDQEGHHLINYLELQKCMKFLPKVTFAQVFFLLCSLITHGLMLFPQWVKTGLGCRPQTSNTIHILDLCVEGHLE